MEKLLQELKEKYNELKTLDIQIQNLELQLLDYKNEIGYKFRVQHQLHEEVERSYKENLVNYF